MIQSVWKNLTGLQKAAEHLCVTLNEPQTHHQTPMTCTYGIQSSHTLQNWCNRSGNTMFKYMNYVSIFVGTVCKCFFTSKEGGVSTFVHIMNVKPLVFGDEFVAHLKSHQRCSAAFCRPVKFFHTDWIIISLWFLSYTQRHCHAIIHFTFMHLAVAFIQSDLHCIQVSFYILSALAFPGNRTHDLSVASAMLYQLSYRKAVKSFTGKLIIEKSSVQTVAIQLETHNSIEYHYMLKH